MSFSPVIVAALGIILLAESLNRLQCFGIGLFLVGVLIYLYPLSLPTKQGVGLAIVTLGVLANAASSILGRHVNRRKDIDPLSVTIVSMGVGAFVLLVAGIVQLRKLEILRRSVVPNDTPLSGRGQEELIER